MVLVAPQSLFNRVLLIYVTTKLSRSRMSWSDQRSKVGGQTVAVGPSVGCGVAVGSAVTSTEATRVGSADAVGSRFMVWVGAGLHA
jgi:hypothetical protein